MNLGFEGLLLPFGGKIPRPGPGVFLAPNACLIGDVEAGEDTSFWFHTVARADVHFIRLGRGVNIQDGSCLHVTGGTHPLVIGDGVSVGHGVVLHGCTVEDGALIAIGARVLDGAVVGRGSLVAAGSLVTPGTVLPPGVVAMGAPARAVRPVSDQEKEMLLTIPRTYVDLKNAYLNSLAGGVPGS